MLEPYIEMRASIDARIARSVAWQKRGRCYGCGDVATQRVELVWMGETGRLYCPLHTGEWVVYGYGEFVKPLRDVEHFVMLKLQETRAAVNARLANGWLPHWGMHCWYRGTPGTYQYGLPGEERISMTDAEHEWLWPSGFSPMRNYANAFPPAYSEDPDRGFRLRVDDPQNNWVRFRSIPSGATRPQFIFLLISIAVLFVVFGGIVIEGVRP